MPEAATALLALWNDVDAALDALYNEWHALEHVPERLTVPGFLWARRYGRVAPHAMPRYLTLYGLRDAAVLDGEAYRRLLREPTPTSRRMRPALTNLSRWVCRLVEPGALDDGSHLAVRALETGPVTSPDAQRLVAERLPDAPGLPWLRPGQGERPVEGRWLVCRPHDGVPARASRPTGDAAEYVRLPIG
jgi:hypothetical protein